MDWKEFLEKGSVTALITACALYLSGLEFYLSQLHGLGTGVFFIIPIEYAVVEGLASVRSVGIICVLCLMAGYFVRTRAVNKRMKWALILLGCVVVLAWFTPFIAEKVLDVPRMRGFIAGAEWRLFCFGAPACVLMFMVGAYASADPIWRKFTYFWASVAFILWSYLYSGLLGEAFALPMHHKQRAIITFSEDSIQKEYAGSIFHPVMEREDDLILLRFPSQIQTKTDQVGTLVFIKKDLINKIEIANSEIKESVTK
jgi:hypothetical protein